MASTPASKGKEERRGEATCPPGFSPSVTSASSTPSKALSAKLNSLDQKWSEHKAQSPIKIPRPNQKRRQLRPSPGDPGIHSSNNNRSRHNRPTTRGRNSRSVSDKDASDEISLGDNSVSTLGSTESVFDRLYRQGTRSPRAKTSSDNQHLVGKNVPSGRRGSFGSQPTLSRRSNSSIKSKKDRLGAYGNSTIRDATVGSYGEETPRRRTNRNSSLSLRYNASGHQSCDRMKNTDASSVASSISGGSDFDGKSSVFDRLYQNTKRTEKLWKKPKQFKPILSPSPSSARNIRKTDSTKSRGQVEERVFFPDGEKDSKKIKDKERQRPNRPATIPTEKNPETEKNAVASIEIDTTLDRDLEAIYGAQLENSDDISYPITGETIISPTHTEHNRLESAHEEDNELLQENTASIEIVTTLEEDLEAINEIGVQLANINGGCSPTVAATSISSANWEESSHARRHCNNNDHGFVLGIPTIASFGTSVDEEVDVLEAVAKQLQKMEADQDDFLCTKASACNHVEDQKKASIAQNGTLALVGQNDVLLTDESINHSHIDRVRINEERTMIPRSSNDTVSSTGSASDTSGFFSLKSTRSFTLDLLVPQSDFSAKRLDRASCSLVGENANPSRSAMIIQKAWRMHCAEIKLASAMIRSWNSDIQFQQKNKDLMNSYIYRQRVLEQAVRAAKCWWILEGLHIEDNWISIAWENEVHVGTNVLVQVNLTCEAQSLRITSRRWDPTKLAVLLVKAILQTAICNEKSSRRVAKWYQHSKGKLHRKATLIQRWIRKCRRRTALRKGNEELFKNKNPVSSANTDGVEPCLDLFQNENEASPDIVCEGGINMIPNPTNDSPMIYRDPHEDYVAAVKIQSFLRLAVLKSAVKDWPSAMGQFRAALKTAGVLSNHETTLDAFDEFKAARNILCNTIIVQHFCGTGVSLAGVESQTNIALKTDFVSQQAASLAIHNTVRAYLVGLKKYRDKRRATLIQATFRGYNTRKRLELEDLSAVVIQFAWSNCRYLRVRAGNATKIQRILRMVICKRNYDMTRFCIIFIQAGWRRAIAVRRLVLVRSAITLIQRTWRRSRENDAYSKFRSAIRSIQYIFRIRRTINIYRFQCQIATMLQSWWRSQSARMFLLRSLDACICVQSNFRSLIQCRNFHKIRFDIIMVQRNWRTYICWKRFESQKTGVLRLQIVCRRKLSANAAKRRRRSILDIQRVYRGYICKNLLTKGVQNVTKIQNCWRRHMAHAFYVNAVKSITTLQAFARVLIAKRRFKASHEAIIHMQRVTRGWQCRHRIPFYKEQAQKELAEKQSNAAKALQKLWRGDIERQRYTKFLRSLIILQKLSRRKLTQSVYIRKLNAARTIQLWLRRIIAESRAQKAHIASITIQCFWRASVASKHTTAIRFKKAYASSTKIQSVCRGVQTRNQYRRILVAIISIQASIRRKSAVNSVNALVQQKLRNNSSILIQSQWRGAMSRNHYAVNRVSAIMIQAATRRLLSSKYAEKLMQQRATERAIILVQSQWRRLKQYEQYIKRRTSAVTIQACARRVFASNLTRELRRARSWAASLLIQRIWRGEIARESLSRARSSATKIQASVRRMNASNAKRELEYEKLLRKAATLIQSTWRRLLCRYRYYIFLRAAVTIQAAARRILASKRTKLLQKKNLSLVLIQSHCRGAIARDRYMLIRVASTMIQAAVRGMLARERQKMSEQSAVLIQASWRGVVGRYHYYEALLHLFSAISIQTASRRMLASMRTKLLKTQIQSSVLIQTIWRGALARDRYSEIRIAAIMLQACARGMLTREKCAHKLTSVKEMVGFETHSYNQNEICAMITSSKAQIMFFQRVIPQNRSAQHPVVKLQSFARGCLLRKQLKLNRAKHQEEVLRHQKTTASCILIQSQWRALNAHDAYVKCRVSSIMIQSFVRGYLLRKQLRINRAKHQEEELRHQRATSSCILIQSQWRASNAHDAYVKCRVSSIMIQSFVRGYLLRKQLRINRAKQQEEVLMRQNATTSCILIQSQWRASNARGKYVEYRVSSIMIQSFVRGYLLRKQLRINRAKQQEEELRHQKATSSCIVIQSQWRASNARGEYASCRVSSSMIQSFVRGFLLRRQLRLASTLIQCQWRASKARDEYMQYRVSSIMIQSFVRGFLLRKELQLASTLIQSQWRASKARDEYMQWRVSSIMIQSFVRGYLFRKELEIDSTNQQEGKPMHQKATESCILIQSKWRASKARDEYTRCRGASMMIQAMIRGVFTRSQLKSNQDSISHQLVYDQLRTKHISQCHPSAIQFQRVWKGNGMYQKVIESSTLTPLLWRGSIARCEFAAKIIQAMIRGAQVRSQWRFVRMLSKRKRIYNGSARKIQIAYILWRMNIALWEAKSLAVLLKRGIRGQLAHSVIYFALRHMNSLRNSTILGSHDRLRIDACEDHKVARIIAWHTAVSDVRISAAIVIQSYVRRFITRNLTSKIFGLTFNRRLVYVMPTATSQSAGIVIQRVFLRWLQLRIRSAVLIQKTVRLWIAFEKYNNFILPADRRRKIEAATRIQSLNRCRNQRHIFTLRKQAIIHIQNSWRKVLARRVFSQYRAEHRLLLQTLAITRIQSLQRCQRQRSTFLLKRKAVITIQNLWRRVLAQKVFSEYRAEHRLLLQTLAITRIQTLQRCQRQRSTFLLKRKAVITIQNLWRRVLAQKVFSEYRAEHCLLLQTLAITRIQSLQRCQRQRSTFLLKRKAVITIQNLWRKVLERKSFVTLKNAAYRIQLKYRSYLQRKKHRGLLVSGVVVVQSLARRRIAQRVAVKRQHAIQLQTKVASEKVLTETRDASILIAENLLSHRELTEIGPCMRRLADRVNCTLSETKSCSRDVVPNFIHQFHLDIPLPPKDRKAASPELSNSKLSGLGTPARCNRANTDPHVSEWNTHNLSSKSSHAGAFDHPERNLAKISENENPRAEATKDGAVQRRNDDGVNTLAKQASELLREARAAIQTKKSSAFLEEKASKAVLFTLKGASSGKGGSLGGSPNIQCIDDRTSVEFFEGDSSMPSPIRSEEPKSDWDWTSTW